MEASGTRRLSMKFFRDLALAALAAMTAAVLIEGGLRLARLRYLGMPYQYDARRGYALRPNAAAWSTGEADMWIQTNSDGMRDRERAVSRPADTLRIAV